MKSAPDQETSAKQGSSTIYTALQSEALEAVKSDPEKKHYTGALFALMGKPGVWRRVARSGQGRAINRPGAELANYWTTLIEVVRDEQAEKELAVFGFKLGSGDDQEEAVEALQAWEKEQAAKPKAEKPAPKEAPKVDAKPVEPDPNDLPEASDEAGEEGEDGKF
jgi:hypothetical protein